MARDPQSSSYWNATASSGSFPALAGDHQADVAIIGGGIVGATTARLLKDRGLKVILLEARGVGEEVTGKSTAKITSQHNIVYTVLKRKFGEDGARLYADANQAGIALLRELAARHAIACSLKTRPAFTYTCDEGEAGKLEEEVALARSLGLPASLTTKAGLPFFVCQAMRWDDQAQFHPVDYVKSLAATIPGDGSAIYENSRVIDWDSRRVATEHGSVTARHVVMATHLPLGSTGYFFAENYPHMHPVIMGPAAPAKVPPGMYISVETPRHSTRGHRDADGKDWMIFTGPSFRHGHVDEERASFTEIESFAFRHFGVTPTWRWTNEDYTPMDHAPFIGPSSSADDHVLVATGFNAWGISTGTAAAILLADLIQGRDNDWLKLFDARRVKPLAAAKEFVTGNAHVAGALVGGFLKRKLHSFDELQRGEAAILKLDGENVAGYRDDRGALHAVSAACTHMGCLVGWNETDRTWDCPCHGSRFALDGSVIHGPAVKALAPAKAEARQPAEAD